MDPIFQLDTVKGAGGRDTRVTWRNRYVAQGNADLASAAIVALATGIAQAEAINLLDDVSIMRVVVKKIGNFAPLENRKRRKIVKVNLAGLRPSTKNVALPEAHTEKIGLPLNVCLLVDAQVAEQDSGRKVFRRMLTSEDIKLGAQGDWILNDAGFYGDLAPIQDFPAALMNALPVGFNFVIPEKLDKVLGTMNSRLITAWSESGVVFHQLHNRRKSADQALKEGVQRKINEWIKQAEDLIPAGKTVADLAGAALATFVALKGAAMAEYLALPAAEQAAIDLGLFALAA